MTHLIVRLRERLRAAGEEGQTTLEWPVVSALVLIAGAAAIEAVAPGGIQGVITDAFAAIQGLV